MNTASVVIADIHPLIRAGMAALIEADDGFTLLGQASDSAQTLELCRRLRPDLVLMDLNLPGCDGIEAINRIRAQQPSAKVVILSGHDGEDEVDRSMRAGADAYMLKSAPLDTLMAGLHTVMSGKKYMMPELAVKLATRIQGNQLTPRERDILGHLATGMSNKVIARAAGIGVGTVKFHVKSIMSKLNVCTRTEAAMVAARRGLVQMA
ncbi:response regulator [Duganella aceris]|jgi:two-component system NarL family response regulator|uniref:Response regulator transcription factor n=1 Tax=Duganella aceris TaxID=2703883 RepID=A0ABX0FRN9_9BURK|nr:response regulator transcription factor [Duganella aceris]NGZ87318.1 response regulator transcription factor [Duganella aceris]